MSEKEELSFSIIYVNRNALVANPTYTPYSYPWGGGCTYFSPWLQHFKISRLGKMAVLRQRELLHTRDVAPYANLIEVGTIPFIPSFCDIKLGEGMFRDARSYFNTMISYINKEYSVRTAAELSAQQKIDTARHLHFNYNSSNQQLRRLLRMDLAILEEMFP